MFPRSLPCRRRASVRRLALGLAFLASAAVPLRAQLITPKTVPIHQGEQFGIYPSQWPGMGGVSIALHDTLGDPWSNPAKATRLRVGSIQVMPFTHTATAGGRTLPVMLQTSRHGRRRVVSLQEVERRDAVFAINAGGPRTSICRRTARRFEPGSIGAGLR